MGTQPYGVGTLQLQQGAQRLVPRAGFGPASRQHVPASPTAEVTIQTAALALSVAPAPSPPPPGTSVPPKISPSVPSPPTMSTPAARSASREGLLGAPMPPNGSTPPSCANALGSRISNMELKNSSSGRVLHTALSPPQRTPFITLFLGSGRGNPRGYSLASSRRSK